MERHVLVVMPHPDDETLAVGGTIAQYTKAGVPVTYLCGTLGQMGRLMGKPPVATRESMPQLREQEMRAACAHLGCDLRLMGLRDKTIEFMDPEELADRIGVVIAELNPSLVITYHPRFSVHPDHMALGAATVRAVARLPREQRPPVHCRAFGTGSEILGEPDLVVDASDVIDMKMAATRDHHSQTSHWMHELDAKKDEDPAEYQKMIAQRSKESFFIYRIED
jgi:N-acetylglucosamine malate deacetylase 2